jgi:acyl-CoA synthetase (AMP-forming)/AMP-acid ligase II
MEAPTQVSPKGQVNVTTQPIDDSSLLTVDDLVRHRANLLGDQTIVAYPSSGIKYVEYSARQLNLLAYRVARQYQDRFPVRASSAAKPIVVAMLGPSNFEYAVTMLALIKLGHTILFLSTRISAEAVASLMQTTNAKSLLIDPRYASTIRDIQDTLPQVRVFDIAPQSTFDFSVDIHGDTRLDAHLDPQIEASNYVYIIHSSGKLFQGLMEPGVLTTYRLDGTTEADISDT